MADEPELQTLETPERESVADDVRAALEQVSKADLGEQLIKEPPANETESQKADRLRDESGKFVRADKVVAQSAPKPITDADPAQGNSVAPSSALEVPKTWSAEAKTEWLKLSPAVQQAVLKRETEIDAGGRQWSEQRQAYERVLSPVAELSKANGLSVEDGITRLLTVENRLASDGPNMIRELAAAYGVDLTALVNGTPQPEKQSAAPQFDPNVIPQIIDQRLNEALTERDQITALKQEISTFSAAPGHEHFADVQVLMGHLLKSGQASDMQEAYDKAVWATPSVREKLLAAQTAQNPAKDANAIRRKAGGVSLNGAPRGQAPVNRQQTNGTVLDDVRAAVEQHGGF